MVSVSELRANISVRAASAADAQRLKFENVLDERCMHAECTMVLPFMFGIARLNAQICDFPSRVPLHSENGYMQGICLQRSAAGVWGLVRDDAVSKFATYGMSTSISDTASVAMRAMKIVHSSEAMTAISSMVSMKTMNDFTFCTAYRDACNFLPVHAVRALPASPLTMRAAGVDADRAGIWVNSSESRFTEPVLTCSEAWKRLPPPLHMLSSARFYRSMPLFEEVLVKTGDSDLRDSYQSTALMRALAVGNYEEANMLLDVGAKVNARNVDGNSPLHYLAGLQEPDERTVVMFRRLLRAGAARDMRNSDGYTADDILGMQHSNLTDDNNNLPGNNQEYADTIDEIRSILDDGAIKPVK